jgi:Predicted hydrolases of the HAD superfamily
MVLKLIGIDMDDTLLRGNKTYEEERFRKIFEELRKNDVTLVIASGNSYPRLDEYFSHMNHDDLYFAGDNGNFIVKKN